MIRILFYLFLCCNLVSCTLVVCDEYYKDTDVINGVESVTKKIINNDTEKEYGF